MYIRLTQASSPARLATALWSTHMYAHLRTNTGRLQQQKKCDLRYIALIVILITDTMPLMSSCTLLRPRPPLYLHFLGRLQQQKCVTNATWNYRHNAFIMSSCTLSLLRPRPPSHFHLHHHILGRLARVKVTCDLRYLLQQP